MTVETPEPNNPSPNDTAQTLTWVLRLVAVLGFVGGLVGVWVSGKRRRLMHGFTALAAGSLIVGFVTEARNILAENRKAPPVPPEPTPQPHPDPEPNVIVAAPTPEPRRAFITLPARAMQVNRMGVFAVLAVGMIVALMLVPRPYSTWLFYGLLAAPLILALTYAPGAVARVPALVSRLWAAALLGWTATRGYRGLLGALTAGVALLVMIWSTMLYEWRNVINDARVIDATRVMLLGGALVGVASVLSPIVIEMMRPAEGRSAVRRRMGVMHWLSLFVGVALLAALAEMSGRAFEIPYFHARTHVQVAMWGSGIACIAWGLGAMGRLRWLRPGRWSPALRREVLIVAVVTLVAFVIRMWRLEDALRHYVDEIIFVDTVNRLGWNERQPLLQVMGGIVPFTWIFTYFQKLLSDIFGRNMVSFRLISVVIGTLNIPALYFLLRTVMNKRVALLGAVLLLGFPLHIHFSRIGLNQVVDTLIGVLALAYLARALDQNRRADYALAGALLGMTQYFYEGGRLFFPMLTVAWLVALTVFWRDRMRVKWRGVGLFALTAVLVGAPYYYVQAAIGAQFASRVDTTSLGVSYLLDVLVNPNATQDYWRRITDTFLVLVHMPESSLYFAGKGPLLMPLMIVPFLLGLWVCLTRLREPGALLLLGWVALTMFGNSLLINTTFSNRYFIGSPAWMAVAAVGGWWLLRTLSPFGERDAMTARVRWAVALILVVGAAGYQTWYYFNPHLDLYNVQVRGGRLSPHDAVIRVKELDLPDHTRLTFVYANTRLNELNSILQFQNENMLAVEVVPTAFDRGYLDRLERDRTHAFFFDPRDADTLNLLRAYYGDELSDIQYSHDGLPRYYQLAMVVVPEETP